ncbi:hypothetical protein N657DRAFT_682519 [Parathielavia appendiculata]|uniref:Uncharacterized protein n=1 Tax=Parathielavia appendiculata TaxID=2587402 RepID=A0AAN6TWY9_9PEZI|nr:hypothetical protein N657DRAFT_682519 [Parathielavia appendiculata]
MDDSATKLKDISDQPYIEISQVDDASAADGQDAEPSPESAGDPGERQQNPPLPEGKPVILGTDARLWTSLVHVLPLATSVFLITINIRRLYWFDEEGIRWLHLSADSVRNVLQLAAKVYELLVIASLGALTVKVFKRQLIESHLPLGLLTGAYRVSDIPYVFGGFFWHAFRETSCLLALLLFGNTILSTLVGPSSAILLVPELDWYPLPGAFSNVHPVFFYNLPTNSTWPYVVNTNLSETSSEWISFRAPNATEHHPVLASMTVHYRGGSDPDAGGWAGVWVFACGIIAHWMPAALSVSPRDTDLVQSNVTDFISGMKHYNLSPLIVSAGPAIKFEEDWLDFLALKVNVSETPSGNITGFRPVLSIFNGLLGETGVFLEPAGNQNVDSGQVDPEQIRINRLRAKSYVQKAFTGIVTEALARIAGKSRSYVVRSYDNAAVVVTDIGTQAVGQNEVATWSDGRPFIDGRYRKPLLMKFNESILSHLEYVSSDDRREFVGYYSSPQEFVNNLSALTHLEFGVERYGYGSGRGGPTMTFALAVIYTYMIILGTYFLYVMVVSKFWLMSDIPTISAWGDMAEVVLLAWNSKSSPALSRTSVAVDKSRWRVEVGIRADATGRAQLVTSNDGVERLRRNELYH